MFVFDAFNANAFLKLTGPATAITNHPAFFTVTDGQTGKPVAGATLSGPASLSFLGGVVSNGNGEFGVAFHVPGTFALKASKLNAIRSNAFTVQVS